MRLHLRFSTFSITLKVCFNNTRQNLLIKPEKFDLLSRGKYHRALVNSSSMIGIESEPKWFHHRGRQWFHHNGHSSSALRLYSLDPKYADIVNAAISRWRLRYGIRIQEKLINKGWK